MGRISVEANAIDRVLRWGTATGEPDDLLLARFLAERDEGAFAALVDRHGPMVLGVCRRILRDGRDVEDAFQATFLILARRGGTIRRRERVGPWIHGVAHRVAVRARAVSARRFVREGAGLDAEPSTDAPPGVEAERGELRSILDEELRRLPERLRDPLVLCHLEGLTHDQAAAALRQPVGTIRSRLSRGRDKLRDRLARRGVSADDVRTAPLLAHPVSTALLESTLRSALAFTSPPTTALASAGAAILAKGALDAMFTTKAKLAAVALGTLLTLGGASGYALQQGGGGSGGEAAIDVSSPPTSRLEEPPQPSPKAGFDQLAFEASLRKYLGRVEEALQERSRELKIAEFRRDQLKAEHASLLENRSIVRKRLEELSQTANSGTPEATKQGVPEQGAPTDASSTDTRSPVRKELLEPVEQRTLPKGAALGSLFVEKDGMKYPIPVPPQIPVETAKASGSGEPVASEPRDEKAAVVATLGEVERAEEILRVQSMERDRIEAGIQVTTTNLTRARERLAHLKGQHAPAPVGTATEKPAVTDEAGKKEASKSPIASLVNSGFTPLAGPIGPAARRSEAVLQTMKLAISLSRDGRYVSGYSVETGLAKTIPIPATGGGEGSSVKPIVTNVLGALALKGERIDRIAVFSATDGDWHIQDLVEPTTEATPIVGPAALVAYKIGRRIYAFSAVANRWDMVELPEDTGQVPYVGPETIGCPSHGYLYLFSGKAGIWASLRIPDETEGAGSTPPPAR